MGEGTGVAGEGRVKNGLKKVASGVAIGAMALSFAACSSSSGAKAIGTVTLQKALDDYRAGNVTLAKSEFQQLVKEDPNNKFGWYNLGVLAQYAGNTNDAATNYQKSIAIDPNFESALYNYGVLRMGSNDMDTAITYLGRAVAQNSKDANAHWNLGLALAKRGNTSKDDNTRSKNELNAGLKLDPSLIKTLGSPSGSATTTTSTP